MNHELIKCNVSFDNGSDSVLCRVRTTCPKLQTSTKVWLDFGKQNSTIYTLGAALVGMFRQACYVEFVSATKFVIFFYYYLHKNKKVKESKRFVEKENELSYFSFQNS